MTAWRRKPLLLLLLQETILTRRTCRGTRRLSHMRRIMILRPARLARPRRTKRTPLRNRGRVGNLLRRAPTSTPREQAPNTIGAPGSPRRVEILTQKPLEQGKKLDVCFGLVPSDFSLHFFSFSFFANDCLKAFLRNNVKSRGHPTMALREDLVVTTTVVYGKGLIGLA